MQQTHTVASWAQLLPLHSVSPGSDNCDKQLALVVGRWTAMAKRVLNCLSADVNHDAAARGPLAFLKPQDSNEPTVCHSVLVVPVRVLRTEWATELCVSDTPDRVWSADDIASLCDIASALSNELNVIWERQEHIHVVAQLRLSEEIHRALAEASSEIIWVSDPNGGIVEPCTTWQAFTGQKASDIVGFGCLDAIHPDDQDQVRQFWDRASRQPGKMNLVYRLRHHSGEWRWMSECSVPLYSTEGRLKGWAGLSADVNERKLQQERLARNESRFRALVEASSQIVWTANADGCIVEDSPSWRTFTGRTQQDWLGDRWIEAIHPEDRAAVASRWRNPIETGRPTHAEYRLGNAAGQWRWMSERAVPFGQTDERREGWVGMAVDITDRKLAELELAGRERHLSLALKVTRMAAWSFDFETEELTISGDGGSLIGLEGTGNRLSDLLARMERTEAKNFETIIATAKPGDPVLHYEFQLRNAGASRWISAEGQCVNGLSGSANVLRGIFNDITDRKLADERRNLLIGEIAHRGKNLLAVVQSIASITLAGDRASEPTYRKFLERLASLARSHSLLTDKDWLGVPLDEIVRLEFGHLKDRVSIDVAPVILNPSAAQNCSLVLHELVTNAVKYGALSVGTGKVTVSGLIEKREDEDCVMFSWTETGGPTVKTPTRRGFGSMLLRRLIDGFDTPGTIEFDPEGLRVQVAMPLNMIRPTEDSINHCTHAHAN